MNGAWPRVALFVAIIGAVVAFVHFDLIAYFSFESLKARYASLEAYTDAHRLTAVAVYFGVYVVTTALSLPGAAVLTVAGGALFGLAVGTLVTSFASTLGATLAFLSARFVFGGAVQRRFAARLKTVNTGIERDGATYLLSLRLVPIFPFFVINLVMGLTTMRIGTFFFVSQVGMLPGTLVFVNAGTELAHLDSLDGILSPSLLASFVLIALVPPLSGGIFRALRSWWKLRPYPRPPRFDYNVVVIGAGAAGLVASYIAAIARAKVALVERNAMGGDCLNTGCVPSKALLRSAQLLADAHRARDFGLKRMDAEFSFNEVMDRIRRVIATIEPHDSVERYEGLGVEVVLGDATVVSPFEVRVSKGGKARTLYTRAIVLATGAEPFIPSIDGIPTDAVLTTENVWRLQSLPEHLVVLGGGPVGCELAQAFRRFGSQVTIVEREPGLLPREDTDVQDLLCRRFEREGIRVLVRHTAKRFVRQDDQEVLECAGPEGTQVRIAFDRVLVAAGRRARTRGFGLEELGIETTKNAIRTNELLSTNIPNIYVCGDAVDSPALTHVASHEAWYAAVNALLSPYKTFRVDYSIVPWCTYTEPEVAHVGLNEREARESGIAVEVTRYDLRELDRAVTEASTEGFVKVLTHSGSDRIAGVTIAGAHAGELIAEYVLAMKHGIGLKKILGTIHTYPTFAEANRLVAGAWRREHQPERLLKVAERLLAWRRRRGA